MSPGGESSNQSVCDLQEFYAAGAESPRSHDLDQLSLSVLTYKSIGRNVPGHHVSDVPVVISLRLIAGEIKKRTGIRGQAIRPSAHKTHPLFQFNPIRHPLKLQLLSGKPDQLVVNSHVCSCYFPPSYVYSIIISLSCPRCKMPYVEFQLRQKMIKFILVLAIVVFT